MYLFRIISGCIDHISIEAQTGDSAGAGQDPNYGSNPLLVLQTERGNHYIQIPGAKDSGRKVAFEFATSEFKPSLQSCLHQHDIEQVYLQAAAGGVDGWHVASIETYAKTQNKPYVELTSDKNFDKWIDHKSDETRFINLSPAIQSRLCLKSLRIDAVTGRHRNAGFYTYYTRHKIVLHLKNASPIKATLRKNAVRNARYSLTLNIERDFQPRINCLLRRDITGVSLEYGGTKYGRDSWLIASFRAYVTDSNNREEKLVDVKRYYHWLYSRYRNINFKPVPPPPSPTSPIDHPTCGYGFPVCECRKTASQCVINLEIDEIRTFTSYTKYPVGAGDGIFVRGAQGVIYEINNQGKTEFLKPYKSRQCAKNFKPTTCSAPQFVDGKTYRMAIGVNGQIPGPTIIVHDQQMVTIHVHNNMSSEGISIHWHGMHQAETPWMDGVGQITQCQIGPSSSYSYIYKASPSGTFWYHSHTGAQRTDGFFGSLVVKEKPQTLRKVMQDLRMTFEDHPDKHTISLLDWQHEVSLDLFSQLHAGLGFYPGVKIGEVPPNRDGIRYGSTRSYDEGEVGPVPYYSGIINGRGRHDDVKYIKTRLSTFPVKQGKRYRFRLVGAQGLYAYKFSIDGHKLIVVNTDGYWTRPTRPADYIIIHSGERYDFILTANQRQKNYWMRAETLEIDRESNNKRPPFRSLGHVAEAILQYTTDINNPPNIPSSQYTTIKSQSPKRICTSSRRCVAVNCPFQNFHRSYFTDCINVNQLTLLHPTPQNQLPNAYPDSNCKDCQHFFNFNFEGDSETSSINGRNFVLPPSPPQTQYTDFLKQSKICDLKADCNPPTLACQCTNMVSISKHRATIQFVLAWAYISCSRHWVSKVQPKHWFY